MRDHRWVVVGGGVLVAIAIHALLFAFAVPHAAVTGPVVAGLVAVIVLKHAGVFVPVVALLRRKNAADRAEPRDRP